MPDFEKIKLESGQELLGEEVSFEPIREPWSIFKLDDGAFLKVRPIVVRVFRVVNEDGSPAYVDSGDPHFVARHRVEVVFSRVE